MLEWNPRLMTLLVAVVAIAALLGVLGTGLGHFGWR
jgi:hypothetical protein